METATKRIIFILAAIIGLFVFTTSVSAYAPSYGTLDYPSNQYGMEARYYNGPWGERMVYGAYGYFPNFNGNYGYGTYGYMYTPQDLRYGNTMRFVNYGSYGGYGSYGSGRRAY